MQYANTDMSANSLINWMHFIISSLNIWTHMKSLRSVNYSRLWNCCQSSQRFYLNLLGLLYYVASKMEKKQQKHKGILEPHCEAWNLHCQVVINVKVGSRGFWTPSEALFPIIRCLLLLCLFCVHVCACVRVLADWTSALHRCVSMVYMSPATLLGMKERLFSCPSGLQGYTTFEHPNTEHERKCSAKYLYLNVFSKNHLFPNIRQGSYPPPNELFLYPNFYKVFTVGHCPACHLIWGRDFSTTEQSLETIPLKPSHTVLVLDACEDQLIKKFKTFLKKFNTDLDIIHGGLLS